MGRYEIATEKAVGGLPQRQKVWQLVHMAQHASGRRNVRPSRAALAGIGSKLQVS